MQTPVASPFVIPKCSDGEIGRHEGLKVKASAMRNLSALLEIIDVESP